jgi:hypothetical protein
MSQKLPEGYAHFCPDRANQAVHGCRDQGDAEERRCRETAPVQPAEVERMSNLVYVLVDKAGAVRRAGTTLHDATKPQYKSEFSSAEWNTLWAAPSPNERLRAYTAMGWQLQEIEVIRKPA